MKTLVAIVLSVVALALAYAVWRASDRVALEPRPRKAPPHSVQWQPSQVSYRAPAGQPFVFPLPTLERTPEGMPVEVTLDESGDAPPWLQLDPERLDIRGTAPLTTEDQTYGVVVRVRAAQGSESRLSLWLTITGQPEGNTPPPQLPGHWTW
jgi:hypothetical protein